MRLCASCEARSSSLSIGICCSRATGLLSRVRQRTGSSRERGWSYRDPSSTRDSARARPAADAPGRRTARAFALPSPSAPAARRPSSADACLRRQTSGRRLSGRRGHPGAGRARRSERRGTSGRGLRPPGKYLKRGCVGASATNCGRRRSATSPASPSERRIRTRPTLSARSPTVAARTSWRDRARASRPNRRRCRTGAGSSERCCSGFPRRCRSPTRVG